MYKKTITYIDYNGNERKEDHYFNLSKAELIRMEMSVTGGWTESVKRVIEAQDVPAIMEVFEEMIKKSYGIKDADGKGFVKKQEYLDAFMSTEAYSELFVELVTNADAAAAFMNGIIPAELAKQAALAAANQ